MWSIAETNGPIQMLIDFDLAAGQRVTPFALLNLQYPTVVADRVVARYGALMLQRKYQLELLLATGNESRASLFGRH